MRLTELLPCRLRFRLKLRVRPIDPIGEGILLGLIGGFEADTDTGDTPTGEGLLLPPAYRRIEPRDPVRVNSFIVSFGGEMIPDPAVCGPRLAPELPRR